MNLSEYAPIVQRARAYGWMSVREDGSMKIGHKYCPPKTSPAALKQIEDRKRRLAWLEANPGKTLKDWVSFYKQEWRKGRK